MKHISSRHNPLVTRFRAAARGDAGALMLLDGVHLVSDAIAARVPMAHAAISATALESPELQPLIDALSASGTELVTATAPVMEVLSPVRSSSPIVALANRAAHRLEDLYVRQDPVIVAVSDLQDPGNVGAVVRVAEAGGAAGVVVSGASADPYSWKALRGSMGSTLRMPVLQVHDLSSVLAQARQRGSRLIAAVPRGGEPLDQTCLSGSIVFLVGGEGRGLAAPTIDAADERVTIPMSPPVESLNAAVCAALLVFEARRQRQPQHRSPSDGLLVPRRA